MPSGFTPRECVSIHTAARYRRRDRMSKGDDERCVIKTGEAKSYKVNRANDPESLFKFKLRRAQGRQCSGGRVGRKIAISLLSTWNSVFTPRLLCFFFWSSDHPLALLRLSKITGKILLLKKVSVPGWHNHCRFPAPVVKQLCPKFCSTISRSF